MVPGMFCCEDIILLCHRHACVYLGGINGAMAKHFLDIPDIHIGFQKKGGKGMAKHMRGYVHIDCGQVQIFYYHGADGLFGVPLMDPVDKKPPGMVDILFKYHVVFQQDFFDIIIPDLKHPFL